MSNDTNEGAASREMPRYISCKRVWALKIARIEQAPADGERMHAGGDWLLIPEEAGYAPVCVGHDEYVLKHRPHAGGYFVQYEDGYKSFSPAAAFERGCMPEAEWGIPRSQDPKYGINLRGRLFNRSTGAEITCPLFPLLAKDTRSLPMLLEYRSMVPTHDAATQGEVERMVLLFSSWRENNLGDMKQGDSKAPIPPEPRSIDAKAGRTPWPFPSSSRT